MPPEQSRADALAELAAEAAKFVADVVPAGVPVARPVSKLRRVRPPESSAASMTPSASRDASLAIGAGYVACAVAPERGNTRPIVPVDARLHLRIAPATVAALDAAVQTLRDEAPGLRDLERATLVRIGAGLVLADLRANGNGGAVGEAVRAALDPSHRHLAEPLPDLKRWFRRSPSEQD